MTDFEDKFGLPKRTIDELLDYFRQNPFVETVKIYGSRAKGNYKRGSDIDFAVWLKEGGKISTVACDLDELQTPYKFDVTDYKKLTHKGMKDNIDKDGVVFYKN